MPRRGWCLVASTWVSKRMQSNREPSIVALKTVTFLAFPFAESVLRRSLVGEHATNGVAESAMCGVERKTRTLKFSLEAQCGKDR